MMKRRTTYFKMLYRISCCGQFNRKMLQYQKCLKEAERELKEILGKKGYRGKKKQ